MELGKIDLGGSDDVVRERRFDNDGTSDSFYHDMPRLLLLLAMLLAAVVGYVVKQKNNTPDEIIRRSVETMLARPFRTSLEGVSTLKNIPLGYYRSRHSYHPEQGLTENPLVPGSGVSDAKEPPFDPVTALEALSHLSSVNENDREDMYGHGTRHFDGVLALPGVDDESTVTVFEFWVDMRNLQAVRLVLTTIERNIAVDDRGRTFNKETYLNIRYF